MISIVTVSFQSKDTIAATLRSAARQHGVIEHVLIDGGSTDGTAGLIAAGIRPDGRWISEPDRGIADAMNKGIALSRGEWLLFLNADDTLVGEDALARAVSGLATDLDVAAFPIFHGTSDVPRHPRGATPWMNFKTGIFHQGALIRRRLFEEIGLYDTAFRVALDYEFFLRAYRKGARMRTYDGPVFARMGDAGVSSQLDAASLAKRLAEERRAHALWATAALRPLYAAYWGLYPRYRGVRLPPSSAAR